MLIILTPEPDRVLLEDVLQDLRCAQGSGARLPTAVVDSLAFAVNLQELTDVLEQNAGQDLRLLSFVSPHIVPKNMLDRFGLGAFNYHPGPPELPGSRPDCFALRSGVTHFGFTLHRMAARVDSGAILHAERFLIPDEVDWLALEELTYWLMLRDLEQRFPDFFDPAWVVPSADQEVWWSGKGQGKSGGHRCTRAELAQLQALGPEFHGEKLRMFSKTLVGLYSPLR